MITYGRGPSTRSIQSAAVAVAVMAACSAVRLTGTCWGPWRQRRMASNPIGSSGVTV